MLSEIIYSDSSFRRKSLRVKLIVEHGGNIETREDTLVKEIEIGRFFLHHRQVFRGGLWVPTVTCT